MKHLIKILNRTFKQPRKQVYVEGQNKNSRQRKDNLTGCTGVSEKNGVYVARIWEGGKQRHIKQGRDFWEVVCARKSAEHKNNYGNNHGGLK